MKKNAGGSSFLLKENGTGERENVAYEKRISLTKGGKKPANRGKGTRKQGERYYLTRFRRPPS